MEFLESMELAFGYWITSIKIRDLSQISVFFFILFLIIFFFYKISYDTKKD